MQKKPLTLICIFLVALQIALRLSMHFSADANYTMTYTSLRATVFLLMLITSIVGIVKRRYESLIITAAAFWIGHNLEKGTSLEGFLYERHKALYHETAAEVINGDKGEPFIAGNYEGRLIHLEGTKKKLARAIEASRRDKYDLVIFRITSAIGTPSRIVYASNIGAYISEHSKRGHTFIILDPGWCIEFPD